MSKKKYSIQDLIKIMNDLRTKCPWDKKQTLKSLKNLTIEETYELIEALERENYDEIKEELGDLLLHIVFYSKIASEKKQFNFNDVVNFLIEKLIYRHPHIYSDTKVKGEDDVKKNWEKLKLQKSDKGLLDGVPKNLPTLIKATRVQEKVASVLKDYRKKANIPGFRPGQVPMGLVKKQYGKSIMVDEVNKLLQESLNNYLVEEKLDILGNPLPKMDGDFNWDAENFSFEF